MRFISRSTPREIRRLHCMLHFGPDDDRQLVLIDGGPAGIWKDALKPRLDQLRAERGLDENTAARNRVC